MRWQLDHMQIICNGTIYGKFLETQRCQYTCWTQHRHCMPYVDFHKILLQHEKVASTPAIQVCTTTKSSVFAPRSDKQPCQHLTTKFSYRPDALPEAQPTASKHRRQLSPSHTLKCYSKFKKRKPLLYQQSLVWTQHNDMILYSSNSYKIRHYVDVIVRNLSCPAVSQIWSRILFPSMLTFRTLKSTPIVEINVPESTEHNISHKHCTKAWRKA